MLAVADEGYGIPPEEQQAVFGKFYKGSKSPLKVHFVRYADDFIITGATREVLAGEVQPLVEQFLALLELFNGQSFGERDAANGERFARLRHGATTDQPGVGDRMVG